MTAVKRAMWCRLAHRWRYSWPHGVWQRRTCPACANTEFGARHMHQVMEAMDRD